MQITIQTTINSSIQKVWSAWITPENVTKWNFASDDWCCPNAESDFKVGGKFNYRMEAKDGSFGFDFWGVFTSIKEKEEIEFKIGDGRNVLVTFKQVENGVLVNETFEAENENSIELQRTGWQNILDNFKKHVESGA